MATDVSTLAYIDSTGYHFADYPTFLTWLQGANQGVFGADVYLGPDSQDGQWIAIIAKGMFDSAANGSAVYNSFRPADAVGVGLSRLVKINGLERNIPTNSTADLTCVGQGGVTVTGGIAIDTLGQQWLLPPFTFPGGGSIIVTATAAAEGDVTAVADSINQIFTPTLGWQTVNNVADATPGAPVEEDGTLRGRQATSTANPSLTVLEGMAGAIAKLTGVTKVQPYENDGDTTDANGLPGHSNSMVVVGGTDTDIADTIALRKTPGSQTYGSTPIVVVDSRGVPITINFGRAVPATVAVVVHLTQLTGWTSDYETVIADAIAAVINQNAIGQNVLYTKLFLPAYLQNLGNLGLSDTDLANAAAAQGTYDVTEIDLSKNGGSSSQANVTLLYDENAVCDPTVNITFVVT